MRPYTGTRMIGVLSQVVDNDAAAVEVFSAVIDESDENTAVMKEILAEMLKNGSGYVERLATGSSKRTLPDSHDPNLGYDLAFWRAVKKVVDKELKLLDGRIRDQDFQRAHAEQIAAEKVKKKKKSKAKRR